jgi:MFS family permease
VSASSGHAQLSADVTPVASRRGRRALLGGRPTDRRWTVGAYVLVLVLVSAGLRTQAIDAPLWADEGIAEGIASHPIADLIDVLRQDGSPPLYYLLLHGWTRVFGTAEASLHALSLAFALAFVPAALWAGWSLFGLRAGLAAATLAAVNPYLSAYAQEARMYTLLALLGLVASAAFVLAFVDRRRPFAAVFGVALAAMAYTHNWGLMFGACAALTLLALARRADDRGAMLRDGVLAFGLVAVLYLPWLPTLVGQAAETGAPWASRPSVSAPLGIANGLFGGAGPTIALLVGSGAGFVAAGRDGDRRILRSAAVLLALALGTLALAWAASQVSPAWTTRYFGAVLGALLLLAAAGLAHGGRVAAGALVVAVALSLPVPSPTALTNKSNADVVAAETAPQLRPGDHVLSIQAEQVPLLRYYLPPGLRYADPRGPVGDPRVMDWRNALDDLRDTPPAPALAALLRRIPPGGQLLFVAPVTEHRRDWRAPWTELVRRRGAQWGALLEQTPELRQVAVAPRLARPAAAGGETAWRVGHAASASRRLSASPNSARNTGRSPRRRYSSRVAGPPATRTTSATATTRRAPPGRRAWWTTRSIASATCSRTAACGRPSPAISASVSRRRSASSGEPA